MSTILTTGGLGFIGSHTSISLLKKGYDVLIIDSLLNSKINALSNIKKIVFDNENDVKNKLYFRKGDIRDKSWLISIFKEFIDKKKPITSVIHFAGLKSTEESISDPLKYWDMNLNSILSLIAVMKKFQCNNLVFSSSGSVYKYQDKEGISENAYLDPISPYGNTKLCIEKILGDVFKSDNDIWKIASLRYFNPVGAHDSGLIGEDPLINTSNIFPKLMRVINNETEDLLIYGSDWPTRDGTCIRDYIHIMDLANAHSAVLFYLQENNPQYFQLNIGSGKGVTVLELIETFSKVNNCKIPYKFVDRRKGDYPHLVADNSLAIKLMNWKPKKSLEDICTDTWRWLNHYKKN